jgi:glycosyltransferase involved in cell wall biosynthesis
MNGLKILCLGNYPATEHGPFTGPMRVVYHLAEALADLPDTDVTVMTPHRMRRPFGRPEPFGWGRAQVLRISYTTMRFNKDFEYDIINCHGVSHFNALALRNRCLRSVPFVYTAHGLVAREKDLGYRYASGMLRAEKRLILNADRLTTVSGDTGRMIASFYPVKGHEIAIIGNGVDTDLFAPAAYKADDPVIRILFAGDLLPVKGLDFLFKALNLAGNAPYVLQIAGETTPYFESLRNAFAPLFESGHIQMLGRLTQEALRKAYAEADFLTIPSRYDQCPQVMLEALAMGKPVIITDRIGSRHIVSRSGGGYIVEYGNVGAFKEKILKLVHSRSLRNEMGQKARNAALRVTWSRIAQQYRTLFEDIMKTSEKNRAL